MVARDSPPRLTIARFEALDFAAADFGHVEHVYMAWLYLEEKSLAETITRYSATLRRLTRREGVPQRYHETITWFLLALIAERRGRGAATWAEFCAANADLFDDVPGLLNCYYSSARLGSPAARSRFLLPDRAPVERAA